MKKFITYYSFIIVSLMVITSLISANTTSQLISASIFYPLFIYFGLLVWPKKRHVIAPQPKPIQKDLISAIDGQVISTKGNYDLDRRAFLKLIGSAGATVFFFSMFSKKAEAAFFGSMPGSSSTVALKDSTGATVDPAIKSPTDGYRITQVDDSDPAYYGYVNKTGNWFIMKEDNTGGYRYAKGDTSFSTNWTNRAALSYDYFDTAF